MTELFQSVAAKIAFHPDRQLSCSRRRTANDTLRLRWARSATSRSGSSMPLQLKRESASSRIRDGFPPQSTLAFRDQLWYTSENE